LPTSGKGVGVVDDLGERRLELFRELAASLERAQRAVMASKVEQMIRETSRQQEICGELRARRDDKPGTAFTGSSRGAELAGELMRIEKRVAELNRLYAALLRRARRTAEIFCRAMASSALTYDPAQMEMTHR